ncbi:hypothetical protein ACFO1B_51310 [Dactylosporangium siamense]|uniref:Uncharacterized protein n=1 Tax=Dactylosporangium siamense TaxID=685454 RepID=A0A919PYF3_9ACTN|nr:hypothetical protein [Dactylosporangium siamense]GIG51947.1 hypothetical protein Dsi01nite_099880 [Dactylosporangium siamense]
MSPPSRFAALAVLIAGLAVVVTTDSTAGTTPAQTGHGRPATARTVTLPTGDRVTLGTGTGRDLSVRPGPGRAGIRFIVQRTADSVLVIPHDVLPRIAAGAVDRRGFAVSGTGAAASASGSAEGDLVTLTLHHLDRRGGGAASAYSAVTGWDRAIWEWPATGADGTATLRLPKGRYTIGSYLDDDAGTTLLGVPVVDLTGDTTVVLDARAARPVRLSVPEPSARLGFVETGYTVFPSYLDYGVGTLLMGDDLSRVRVGQVGPPAAPTALVGSVTAQWARPDGSGDFTDSPYLYTVAESLPGRVPNGFVKAYHADDFAAVHQHFGTTLPGASAQRQVYPSFTPRMDSSALVVPTTLPSTRVEYRTTATRWTSELWPSDGGRLYQGPTEYRRGQHTTDEWNTGPLGPAFGQTPATTWQWASRTGDEIDVELPLYGDRAGHAGSLLLAGSTRVSLYRGDVLIGESTDSGRFLVPAAPGSYRLEVADVRGDGIGPATRVTAQWTFQSSHVAGTAPVLLPLAAVRYAPVPGSSDLPIAVETQPGVPRPVIRRLTVEVSYDDGTTWSVAPVRQTRTGWTATLHPPARGFVSLRTTTATFTQTVIRAYPVDSGSLNSSMPR